MFKWGKEKRRKLYFLFIVIVQLIMLMIFYGNFPSQVRVSTSSLFLIATVLVLILVHIIIKYLQDKNVSVNNPYVILWLGLISTFIGFTLSVYAQEAFKEKEDKQDLIATIDLAIAQEKNLDDLIDDKMRWIFEDDLWHNEDFNIISNKNTAIEQLINNGDYYNSLSPDARELIGTDQTNRILNQDEIRNSIKIGYDAVKDKPGSEEYDFFWNGYIDYLFAAKLEVYYFINILELEKKYLSESLTKKEYETAAKKKLKLYVVYQKKFNDLSYDDFTKAVTTKDCRTMYIDPFDVNVNAKDRSLQERLLGTDAYSEVKNRIEMHFRYSLYYWIPQGVERFPRNACQREQSEEKK